MIPVTRIALYEILSHPELNSHYGIYL